MISGAGQAVQQLIPRIIDYLTRPRLAISLNNTNSRGIATGEFTYYGEGGPPAYFHHLRVRNRGRRPAEGVYVELAGVRKPNHGPNVLTRRLRLRHPDDSEQHATRRVGIGDFTTWNLGFLISDTNQFHLDIFRADRPPNWKGFLGSNETMQVEVMVLSQTTRPKSVSVDMSWDGIWVNDDPEAMKHHLQVRQKSRFRWRRR